MLAKWDFISPYVLPFKPRQTWLCSHVRSLCRLYSATHSAHRWSTHTYRQLLDRSLGMFRKNNVNARESCICSVLTDIIKPFSLHCNQFNIGGMSLLAAHMPAYFQQAAYVLTPVPILWTTRLMCYQEKSDWRLFFRLPVMLLRILSRQSSAVSAWTIIYIDLMMCLHRGRF